MIEQLPVAWAYILSMLGFVFLGVIVWLIPKHLVMAQAPDQARWRDIRIWATVLICIQLTLYAVFN
ncbi:MAG: hypothetical protein AAF529_11290 [Pseudomonadota bacterium]